VARSHLFVRYAYPPNALGYCGPPDPKAMISASSRGASTGDLVSLARQFKGAWPYLELIAASSDIADPLDPRVVEAYWVGSSLLDNVPASSLLALVRQHPEARLRGGPRREDAVIAGGVAHHSFHVFAVYPWLRLLRSGRREPAITVLERCRIRWGQVESIDGDQVVVQSRPLGFDGHELVLLEARLEQARRRVDRAGLIEDLVPGDVVSLHWDWVCDRLAPEALANLQRFTARSLNAVNASAVQV